MPIVRFILVLLLLEAHGSLANDEARPDATRAGLFLNSLNVSTDTVAAGSSLAVSAALANHGPAPIADASFFLRLYLSSDPTITSDDIYLETQATPPFAANDAKTLSMAPAIPSDTPPGAYYLGARIETGDDTEAPVHSLTGPVVKVVRDVDLVMRTLTTREEMLPMGGKIALVNSVQNVGTTPATSAPIKVSFYLSADATITRTDIPIGSRELFSLLPPGEIDSAETVVKIPVITMPDLVAGQTKGDNQGPSAGGATRIASIRKPFYLGAIIDPDNTQPENNENNNVLLGPQLEAVRDVDLAVTRVETDAKTFPVGTKIALQYTVRNQGATPMVAPAIVEIYLSADDVITPSDTLLGLNSVASLDAGAVANAEMSVNIPANLAPQTYYLGAIADAYGTQPETNEDNNTLLGPQLEAVRDVDLAVTRVETSAKTLPVGTKIALKYAVRNQGTTPMTAPAVVGIYLSTDHVVTPSDILLGMDSIASLDAGAAAKAEMTVNIPASLTPQTYYLGAIADAYGTQPETNEDNNALPGPQLQAVRDVDLAVTRLETSAKTLPAGTRIALKYSVRNQGTTPMTVPVALVGIYLSTDNVITPSDTLLGLNSITSLEAGASDNVEMAAFVPPDLMPNTYYLGIIANIGDQQPEKEKTNNAMTGPKLTITP